MASPFATRTASKPSLAPSSYDPAYGGIPNLPPYTEDTTTQTTSGTRYGTSTVKGTDVQAELIKNLPNYQAMLGQDVANIQANLAGQVAPDVMSLLQQQAAERGVSTGMGGAPNVNAAYLQALGLTSLQLKQLANQQLTAAMGRTPIQQMQTTTTDERTGGTTTGVTRQDLAAQQAIYNAAPVPSAAAQQAILDAIRGASAGAKAGETRPKSASYSQFVGTRPANPMEWAMYR